MLILVDIIITFWLYCDGGVDYIVMEMLIIIIIVFGNG